MTNPVNGRTLPFVGYRDALRCIPFVCAGWNRPRQAQSKKGVQNRKVLVDLFPAARRFVGELQPELRWRVPAPAAIGVSRNFNENLVFPNFQGRFARDEKVCYTIYEDYVKFTT